MADRNPMAKAGIGSGGAAERPRGDADPKRFIALEEELRLAEQEYGAAGTPRWWVRAGDWLAARADRREKVRVNRRFYCLLALVFGNFGLHRFYARRYALGLLYLAFCWTFIPVGMSLADIMAALPMEPDAEGCIQL